MSRILLLCLTLLAGMAAAWSQRRITPVETPATMTQSINETATDTARVNAKRRARSVSYVDDRGLTIYVDTITNEEWTDSTLIGKVHKMQHPLLNSMSIGLNVWDPIMRVSGQEYGLFDAWFELDLHNRYEPTVAVGLGHANHTGPTDNFVYRSPLSIFFRIGANYNFLYNSNPDYRFMAGLHYGFSPFSYSIDDIDADNAYWGEQGSFDIPTQHATVGWIEFALGLRVKLWGPISAGWSFKYHAIVHQSKSEYGRPWYIPGYGSRGAAMTGAFSIIYTIPLSRKAEIGDDDITDAGISDTPPADDNDGDTSADSAGDSSGDTGAAATDEGNEGGTSSDVDGSQQQ